MADQINVSDLLEEEIKDLYSAEKQLLKALPRLAKGAHDPVLQSAFRDHLKETESQVSRLQKIAEILEIKPTGKKCVGMEGCIKEGSEALEEEGDASILDLGLIGAGSRVEHYEMAGYLTAISLASRAGVSEAASLLKESFAEEQAAEKRLRTIAVTLLKKSSPATLARF